MSRRRHLIAALCVLAVITASCTRSESETEIGTAVPADGAPAPVEGDGGNEGGSRLDRGAFGDLEDVCRDGDPSGATEVGLTDDEIRLGTVTDKGSAERPGINQEMYDAAVAFAAWCNEHGGIGGREVVIDDLDARLFEYGQRIDEACEDDFALVGGGAVFDSQDNGARVECGLINIAGYVVTPKASVSDLQVQPVPNAVHQFPSAGYRVLGEKFPDARRFGILWVNLDGPSTVRSQVVETVESLGYEVVFDEQYKPLGETGWRSFVKKMRDRDVQAVEMIGEPENMVALQSAMQTEGWYPEFTHLQPNMQDQKYVEEGAATVSDSTYMRSGFPPFDMADELPAVADYLELMERYNPDGKKALLGMQSLSAFLLFATAAGECGDDLSRACVLSAAGDQEDWTAGGLHAPQQPGNVEAAECSLMLAVTPEGLRYDAELTQPNEGIYNCDPSNVAALDGDYGVAKPSA